MAAEKDSRTYIRVHDGMPDHPKVEGLSDAAFRLLITTWCWNSRHFTDGHVPPASWAKRGTAKARTELIAAGLADLAEDGSVTMHDYTDHQRTAEEVKAILEAKAKGGEVGNHVRWHLQRGVVDPKCDHCTDRTTDRKTVAIPVAIPSQNVAIDIDIDRREERTSEVAVAPSDDDESDDVPAVIDRPDVERVCLRLAMRMVENGCKRPAITNRWRESARLMLDRDERTEVQLNAAIDWCQKDEFWRGNIHSIPKLRAQYDKLRLAAARGGKSNVTPVDFGAPPKDPKDRPAYAVDDVRNRFK